MENFITMYLTVDGIMMLDRRIKWEVKGLFGILRLLCNKYGYCFASNAYLAKIMGVSDRSIRNWLKVLKDYEYIEIEFIYREGTKEIEQRKIRTRPHDDDFLQKVWKENYGEVWKDFSGGVEQNFLDNNKSINKEEKRNIKEKEESKTSKKQEEKSADFSSMQKELEEQINDIEFEKFWKVYPRKTDKTMARKRYLTALKNNDVTYETILKGAENYKAYTETEKQDEKFIKHAATWLNNKCWENEYKINSLNEKKEIVLPESIRGKHLYEMNYEEQQLYYSVVDKYL